MSFATPPRVMLVANTCWYLYNFRRSLLFDLRSSGYEVVLVAPFDEYTKHLASFGFTIHHWDLTRSSINPFLELRSLYALFCIYRREKPLLLHHFTIKACLYGTIAAKFARIYRVINAVTGLGHLFLGSRKRSSLMRKAIKPVYKAAFNARRSTVVFQNASDQEKLIKLGITSSRQSELIRGSGVDVNFFDPKTVLNYSPPGSYTNFVSVLFPSRLIKEKGIYELLDAMNSLWNDNLPVRLLIAGSVDVGNRSSLTLKELDILKANPHVEFLGHIDDMRHVYSSSDIVVLPSWREGLSRALVEAASMERPIITTDVPGCRDVIEHAISGLLVPLNCSSSIELSLRLLINNPDLSLKLGLQARVKVLKEFQLKIVNDATLSTYRRLLPFVDGAFTSYPRNLGVPLPQDVSNVA